MPAPDMLARLGLDALHAAFREADGPAIVASLARQAAALIPTDGPTLEDMSDANGAVIAARQLMADLKLWSEGRLAWRDCLHSLLLYGKPGTGKTFLARAMGRSGGVPLITASFARWQACGHLGEMLRAMTDTFAEAIAAAPCVLFIDEIDAAGSRDSGERQNGSYRRQVVNSFLEQIDIAMRAEGVLIVGACNNVSALDPAILRPGRFDSLVEVPLPGRDELTCMLTHQLGAELRPDELQNLVNAAIGATPAMVDAAIRSARSHARAQCKPMQIAHVIHNLNNGETIDRALVWRIAVHECGHAILAIERNLGALHHVRLGQKDGNKLIPDLGAGLKRDHQNMLAYTLAGRAAESLILGSIGGGSGGSESHCDLAFATRIALAMETSYGFGKDGLLWSPTEPSNRITDPVLRASIREHLDAAETDAKRVLERHRVLLVEMAKDLLLHRILEGKTLNLWIDRINGDAPWGPNDPTGECQKAEGSAIYGKRKDNIDLASQRLGPT
jgi:cell division protease FtsH